MIVNKICPDCEAEYYSHIEKCADCGTALLFLEEYRNAQEEKKRRALRIVEQGVEVREGNLEWMNELRAALADSGIPGRVIAGESCKKSCCGGEWQLVVSREDAGRAQERIEEYFRELDPELRASHELMNQGKCPACGSPVNAGDAECSDCGLTLIIIEEE